MTYRQDFDHTRGDTLPIVFTLDQALDLADEGTKITFSVKVKETDNNYVFQVDKTAVTALADEEAYSYLMKVPAGNTVDLPLGRYYYDLELQANSEVYTLVKGFMDLTFDITRPPIVLPSFVYPDVNGDGIITNVDATLVLRAYNNISMGEPSGLNGVYASVTGATAPTWAANTYYTKDGDNYTLQTEQPQDWATNWTDYYTQTVTPEEQEDRADANRDGKITAVDATFINRFVLACSVGEYDNDAAGWTAFMNNVYTV